MQGHKGIDIDISKGIAKKENFNYKLKALSFGAAVQQLSANQVDGVIAGMNITAERKQTFDFSDAYYTSGVVMAVDKDSKVKTFKDLKGGRSRPKTGTVENLRSRFRASTASKSSISMTRITCITMLRSATRLLVLKTIP